METAATVKAAAAKAKEAARKKLQKFQKKQKKTIVFQDFEISSFGKNMFSIICALILASTSRSVAHE